MIISIVAILLIAFIAYYHMTQGAFTSLLSAALAVLAAALALGNGPWLAATFQQGGFAPYADAVAVCVLFAVIYIVLRFVFDRFIPGNLRLNSTADKILAVLGGVVTGVMAVGTLVVAAEMMPFGQSVAMHSRYEAAERSVRVLGRRRKVDVVTESILTDPFARPGQGAGPILPVDDVVATVTAHLSDGGSLAGPFTRRISDLTPSPLDQAYGQRLGRSAGSKSFLLVGTGGETQARVDSVNVIEAEVPQLFGETNDLITELDRDVPETYVPPPGSVLLVVRVEVDQPAADLDNTFRFALGNAYLAAAGQGHFPIGTMAGGRVLVRNAIDDPLGIDFSGAPDTQAVDLAFEVPRDDVLAEGTRLRDNVLLTFKRYGRLPLGGRAVVAGPPQASPRVAVMRKEDVQAALAALGSGNTPAAPAGDGEAPQDAPAPQAQPEEETPGSAGIMDRIRGGADERNEAIENPEQ